MTSVLMKPKRHPQVTGRLRQERTRQRKNRGRDWSGVVTRNVSHQKLEEGKE